MMIDIAKKASHNDYFIDDTLRTLQLMVKSLHESDKKRKAIESCFSERQGLLFFLSLQNTYCL